MDNDGLRKYKILPVGKVSVTGKGKDKRLHVGEFSMEQPIAGGFGVKSLDEKAIFYQAIRNGESVKDASDLIDVDSRTGLNYLKKIGLAILKPKYEDRPQVEEYDDTPLVWFARDMPEDHPTARRFRDNIIGSRESVLVNLSTVRDLIGFVVEGHGLWDRLMRPAEDNSYIIGMIQKGRSETRD